MIIIVSILAVAGLAFLIVNKLPAKMKPVVSVVLWVVIVYFGYQIYSSIMTPINFNKAKKERYALVIENLKTIRDAELAYASVNRKFTDKFSDLVNFIEKDSFAITEVKNIVVTEQRGRITIDVEKRIVDTVGFEMVKNSFEGRDYKGMMNVPGTDAKFELKTATVEKVQGVMASVFEAKVDKAVVLDGMNKDLIRQEKEALGGVNVPGEYIAVGSLEDVNSNGNWPPFYDGSKEESEN
ncbi:MAG: hypothetical protein GY908_04700 [Flavobacteriales bacterium]|nr:hypothetical protein [Flavobacteriales bacterium]